MIYKMNNKEVRKLLLEFGMTTYGKTMFVICYACFFIMFATVLSALIVFLNNKNPFIGFFLILSANIAVVSFVIGSYAYYKELRIFASKK